MARERKQLDFYSSSPSEINERLQELFLHPQWNDVELEFDYWHDCYLYKDNAAQFRRKLWEHNVPHRVNMSFSDTFAPYVVKTDADLCLGCGGQLSGDQCSACGLVNSLYEEKGDSDFKSNNYSPLARFRRAFVRILRRVGYWLPADEFKKIMEAYSVVSHTQLQQRDGGNHLNQYYCMYKLVEQFVSNEFNRRLVLQKIRLPADRRRLVAWDRRWRAIVDGLDCINYQPTLRQPRRGVNQVSWRVQPSELI